MNRLHQILIGVLVLQLALVAVAFWPREAASAAGSPLLSDFKADDVVGLTINEPGGKNVKLTRQGSGAEAKWILPDAGEYPADSTKITPLLEKVAALKSNRLVTRTAASQGRLKVADNDFNAKVDLQTAGGKSYTLYLGTAAGTNTTHVRVAGTDEVYQGSGLNTWEVRAGMSGWIDTLYLSVPQEEVTGLTLKNANGEWSFTKDDQGKWTMAGLQGNEQLNEGMVTGILNQATALRMERPLGKNDDPAYGLAQPSAVVTLTTKKDNQEKGYTLQIGAKDATDNTYVVKSSESPYYVRVAEYTVQDAVQKTREGFLQQPTPAPAATGASPFTFPTPAP